MNTGSPRLLFASSEVYPFAKSGGLADVSHALPKALSGRFDVSVIMPLYASVDRKAFGIEKLGPRYKIVMGGASYDVQLFGAEIEGVRYYFVHTPLLSEREYLYGPPDEGYEDNALRFGLFCRSVVELLKSTGGPYDLLHLNDWQTALCALLLKEEPSVRTKTLFTIHNLAYQGVFDQSTLKELGIPHRYFTMESLEFYGKVNLMKAGIAYADRVTTVSPGYAREILTSKYGCGLEGFLSLHKKKLRGILNGIDTAHFSPSGDTALAVNYDADTFSKKRENKKAYLKEVGLGGVNKPLFIFISRLTWQKGVELMVEALDEIASLDLNVAMIGEGEAMYHKWFEAIASRHKNMTLFFGYDEALSHRMYAAADFLLMPSSFEPCGLNQMIAMHYGTMPVVHAVGGLKDSVSPVAAFDADRARGFGIRFEEESREAFVAAV